MYVWNFHVICYICICRKMEIIIYEDLKAVENYLTLEDLGDVLQRLSKALPGIYIA